MRTQAQGSDEESKMPAREVVMAHNEQRQFFETVKIENPQYFQGAKVLDMGSLDINGNNRDLFADSQYIGVDIIYGPNVDARSRNHTYKAKPSGYFDVVISSECFEHDKYWQLSLQNAYRLLRSGGLLLFSCATHGRPEHGTTRTTPHDSPATNDYYRNLGPEDIEEALNLDELFDHTFMTTRSSPADLYFYGIKVSK